MNRVWLIGRTTTDIELKTVGTSREFTPMQMVSFTLAVSRDKKPEEGKQNVDFIQCSAYGPMAVTMSKYVKKGTKIAVTGKLSVSVKEKDNDRRTYYTVMTDSFEFLEKKRSDESRGEDDEYDGGAVENRPSAENDKRSSGRQGNQAAQQHPDELPF